jgi:hypothetical protein
MLSAMTSSPSSHCLKVYSSGSPSLGLSNFNGAVLALREVIREIEATTPRQVVVSIGGFFSSLLG